MTTFDRIKKSADNRGMNLRQVATAAGMKSETAIYRYNQGVTPRESTVRAIADVLGVSADYLLGNTDDTIPKQATNEPLDVVDIPDSRRDDLISANGQPINDDDWAIIKAVLAKYQNKSEG